MGAPSKHVNWKWGAHFAHPCAPCPLTKNTAGCAFQELSEQGRHSVCKVLLISLSASVSHFIWYERLALHVFVRHVSFPRREFWTARWWWVGNSVPRSTRTSNTEWEMWNCRNQWVTADRKNHCTRCTCENVCVGWKCSWFTVRFCSTIAAGAFRWYLRQHHHVGQSHLFIH